MKNIIFSIAILIATMSMTSCVKKASDVYGQKTERSYNVEAFNGIEIRDDAVVHFTQDSVTTVRVVGPQKMLDEMELRVSDSLLVINRESEINKEWISLGNNESTTIHLYITAPTLSKVQISGSGAFEAPLVDTKDAFLLTISGSGSVEIASLSAAETTAKIFGSGSIDIDKVQSGPVQTLISGSGEIDLDACSATNVQFSITGSGDIDADFRTAEAVKVIITGSGDVELSGNVASLNTQVSGMGNIDTDNLNIKSR